MRYLREKILKDNFLKKSLQEIKNKAEHVIVSMQGSSKECLAAYSALSVNRVIFLCEDESLTEEFYRNINAYASILEYQGEVMLFPYAFVNQDQEDPILYSEKIKVLRAIKNNENLIVVSSKNALDESISGKEIQEFNLQVDEPFKREDLLSRLVDASFSRVDYVEKPGEFSSRGGVVDIFSHSSNYPARIEVYDDIIESIRLFRTYDQRMFQTVSQYSVIFPAGRGTMALKKAFRKNDLLIFNEKRQAGFSCGFKVTLCEESFHTEPADRILTSPYKKAETSLKALNRMDAFVEWMRTEGINFSSVYILAATEAELSRLKILIKDFKNKGMLRYINSLLTKGFFNSAERFAIIADSEIFNRFQTRISGGLRKKSTPFSLPEKDFNEGDLVVHFSHGIGRYKGITTVKTDNGNAEEVIEVEYLDQAKLFVPREQYYLLEKYVGTKEGHVKLDRLGALKWQKKKEDALLAARDYAARIIRLEAMRSFDKRTPYSMSDNEILLFEQSFPFQETKDQLRSIEEVKEDMIHDSPMNRLILGDAGYGKTEVAARAAFIAAYSGKQTALLAPTTILAEQHYRTFKERMADYPLRVEVLSRFTSQKNQKEIVNDLKDGLVDIVIGTHRLVQKDINFNNLGLLIIDEEQRFGVTHKDYLINRYPSIDLLTLSATPIPRTLYMSLMGVRNMSVILTPPVERRQIQTRIIAEKWGLIRDALLAEMKRGGQAFFVHNRVKSIDKIKLSLEESVPEAKFAVAHGQLHEKDLKQVMSDFADRKYDCLVATNIIESGLDMPNVNTLFVHRADCFGLAELYQLRGRVGRFNRQAYAYLILSSAKVKDPAALKRIKAIQEFSKPGGGYHIAMKDLEIRGAGNILGEEQSGHIAAIGFDLYCKLLRDAVKSLKGEEITPRYEVQLFLGEMPVISVHYINSFAERFNLLKHLALCEEYEEIQNIKEDVQDRFGRMPPSMEDLFQVFSLKCLCRKKGIMKIEKVNDSILITDYKGFLDKKVLKLSSGISIFTEVYNRIRKLKDSDSARELPGWINLRKSP